MSRKHHRGHKGRNQNRDANLSRAKNVQKRNNKDSRTVPKKHSGSSPSNNGRTSKPKVKDSHRPPKGFVFVPKGDVFITRKCTTMSADDGVPAQIVYDTKTGTRVGLYVQQFIHTAVLASAAATAAARAEAVERKDAADLKKARLELAERYFAMPAVDVDMVLARAFAKNSGNVGRTSTLDPARRASLAVEAHVRHMHTEYDLLLRGGLGREEARKRIRAKVKAVKDKWKLKSADNGDDDTEMIGI